MTDEKYHRIIIPEDAPLKEVIKLFNFSDFRPDIHHKDPAWQKWLYDHPDWLEEVDLK